VVQYGHIFYGGECEKATDTTGDTIGSGVLRVAEIPVVHQRI